MRMLICIQLCNPIGCSPPGSSAHGIFQAIILKWLPHPPQGDLPNLGIKPTSPVSPALQAEYALQLEPWGKLLKARQDPKVFENRVPNWEAMDPTKLTTCSCTAQSLSCVQLFAAPWIVACQAPLPMGFSRYCPG